MTSSSQEEPITIVPDFLKETLKKFPAREAYGEWNPQTNSWHSVTWSEFAEELLKWRKALQASNINPGDRAAVLLPNSIDSALADQAILGNGCVPVPLHAVDTPASSAYIINNSEASILFVPKTLRWNAMVSACDSFPNLKLVVVVKEDTLEHAENSPVPVVPLKDWLKAGEKETLSDPKISPDDLACVVYTSGTTGNPKGVMLTHQNIVSNVQGCSEVIDINHNDVYLSFLPFSHTFERTVTYYLAIYTGAKVTFSRGVLKLAEDLQQVKPTIFISVPRVYEQFHTKFLAKVAEQGAMKKALAEHAIDVGWRRFCRENNLAVPSSSMSWLDNFFWPSVGKKFAAALKQVFGGRVRLAIAGGAALNNSLGRFFCALELPLRQGYGLTETSPVVSVAVEGNNNPVTVGNPLPNVQVRLDDAGELQIKAPSVMKGYWKLPEATKEVFTQDGWFKTGDLASIFEAHGRIRINGRLKEIIVTSTGEKIPPTDLELAIQSDPLFEQVLCVGEGRPFITALAVVNENEWKKFAASLNVDSEDPESLMRRDVRLAAIRRLKKSASNFPQYGVPRNVSLLREHWTVDNGLLTVTMKLRRKKILERFQDKVEELYQTPQNK